LRKEKTVRVHSQWIWKKERNKRSRGHEARKNEGLRFTLMVAGGIYWKKEKKDRPIKWS